MSDLDHSISPPEGCTFAAADWKILAAHWYPVALSSEVGVGPHAAMLLDELLVLYRVHDELIVARDLCAHRGVPLSLGRHDGEGVVCRYHVLRYGAGGRCRMNRSFKASSVRRWTSAVLPDAKADGSSIAYRRGLKRLGLGHFFSA
jgi:phenylpropionate dioxygenase-like ring-hydroxylating dioxygenase large terminal subunit